MVIGPVRLGSLCVAIPVYSELVGGWRGHCCLVSYRLVDFGKEWMAHPLGFSRFNKSDQSHRGIKWPWSQSGVGNLTRNCPHLQFSASNMVNELVSYRRLTLQVAAYAMEGEVRVGHRSQDRVSVQTCC